VDEVAAEQPGGDVGFGQPALLARGQDDGDRGRRREQEARGRIGEMDAADIADKTAQVERMDGRSLERHGWAGRQEGGGQNLSAVALAQAGHITPAFYSVSRGGGVAHRRGGQDLASGYEAVCVPAPMRLTTWPPLLDPPRSRPRSWRR